ncbi:MAG: 4Fe-4S dicluster domain-containing protein [Anaerolineae bacterium]|nr:4Fe-4S dicluster domain-containing protein [Anaerolineae bacterium]
MAREGVLEIPKSGVIIFNPAECTGCGTCELMCALYHEGVGGPALSRARVVRYPLVAEFHFLVCQQCPAPSCYFACPSMDGALCIDEETGARYVNEDKCIGCSQCVEACPFDPPRVMYNEEKGVAFKCDLCRGREEGPICVEYCPVEALRLAPGNGG